MSELTTNVNWIAVIVGTVAAFMLGWLWYSPRFFGTKWAEGSKVELGDASEMPVAAMTFQLAGTFLLAWLIGVTAAAEHLAAAILIILTLALFIVTNGLFSKKSTFAIMVDGGFIIAMGIVMILVQAIF